MKSIHIDICLKVCEFSKGFVGISTLQDQSHSKGFLIKQSYLLAHELDLQDAFFSVLTLHSAPHHS